MCTGWGLRSHGVRRREGPLGAGRHHRRGREGIRDRQVSDLSGVRRGWGVGRTGSRYRAGSIDRTGATADLSEGGSGASPVQGSVEIESPEMTGPTWAIPKAADLDLLVGRRIRIMSDRTSERFDPAGTESAVVAGPRGSSIPDPSTVRIHGARRRSSEGRSAAGARSDQRAGSGWSPGPGLPVREGAAEGDRESG